MTMTIDAVYEAGRFRPVQPEELADLDLAEGKQVKLSLNPRLAIRSELQPHRRNCPSAERSRQRE